MFAQQYEIKLIHSLRYTYGFTQTPSTTSAEFSRSPSPSGSGSLKTPSASTNLVQSSVDFNLYYLYYQIQYSN